ncbi:hypothetical protein Tco_0633864 [Tanacetum coccineum]
MANLSGFFKGATLRYALTHNPTVYDSLVKQFWQTATVRTLANGTQQIEASIDNKAYTITEASIRSKLNLADATGISNLSDVEIYEGLGTLGSKTGGWDQFGSPIATALICLSSNRVYNFSKLIFDRMVHNIESDYVPLLPAMLAGAAQDQGEGSAIPAGSQTPLDNDPSTSPPPIPTTDEPLQPPSPPRSPSPSRSHETSPQEEGEVLGCCLKRKSKKVVVSSSEDEETEAQGRKIQNLIDDPLLMKILNSNLRLNIFNSGFEEVNTGSIGVSTGSGPFNTSSKKVSIPSPDNGQREGKAPMIIEETQAPKRTENNYTQAEASLGLKPSGLQKLKSEDCSTRSDLPEEDFAKKMVDLVNQRKKFFAEERAKAKRNFEKNSQTKTTKRQKIDDKDAQSTKEKVDEEKEKEPVKKLGKRRKQIARKGLHTAKDESEKDEASEKDDPSSGINVLINPVPVAVKPPSIASYKIIKQGKKGVYQIVRENGTDKVYISFRAMLNEISRDDLTEL